MRQFFRAVIDVLLFPNPATRRRVRSERAQIKIYRAMADEANAANREIFEMGRRK